MTWSLADLGTERFLVFTYVDLQAGPSGKGVAIGARAPTADEAARAASRPDVTVRMTGVSATPLDPDAIARVALPAAPPWMKFFPQSAPAVTRPWRTHPALARHFHPQCPDDIEATFILLEQKAIERMWVRIDGEHAAGFTGLLLNGADRDPSLAVGTRVLVRPSKSHPPTIAVSPVAASNLERWSSECAQCGFDLVLMPVEELVKLSFPAMPPDATMDTFTTRCLLCRGTMVVKRKA